MYEKIIDPLILLSNLKIEDNSISLIRKNIQYFDDFWILKNKIYTKYIFQEENLKTDAIFSYILKKSKEKDIKSLDLLREYTENKALELFEDIEDQDLRNIYDKFKSVEKIKEISVIQIKNSINQNLVEENLATLAKRTYYG